MTVRDEEKWWFRLLPQLDHAWNGGSTPNSIDNKTTSSMRARAVSLFQYDRSQRKGEP